MAFWFYLAGAIVYALLSVLMRLHIHRICEKFPAKLAAFFGKPKRRIVHKANLHCKATLEILSTKKTFFARLALIEIVFVGMSILEVFSRNNVPVLVKLLGPHGQIASILIVAILIGPATTLFFSSFSALAALGLSLKDDLSRINPSASLPLGLLNGQSNNLLKPWRIGLAYSTILGVLLFTYLPFTILDFTQVIGGFVFLAFTTFFLIFPMYSISHSITKMASTARDRLKEQLAFARKKELKCLMEGRSVPIAMYETEQRILRMLDLLPPGRGFSIPWRNLGAALIGLSGPAYTILSKQMGFG